MTDTYQLSPDFRVVSGGQTGADRAALEWAISRAIDHGGWCPKGRRSEDGRIPDIFCLSETPLANYLQRTEWNVRDSDATVIFTLDEVLTGGSKRTAQFAERHHRPWVHIRPAVHPRYLARFLAKHRVDTLNVAGSRESSAPGVSQFVKEVLSTALSP